MVASLLSHSPVRRANKLFSDNIDYRTIGNHATTIDTGGAIVGQNRGSSWGILAIIRYLKISVDRSKKNILSDNVLKLFGLDRIVGKQAA